MFKEADILEDRLDEAIKQHKAILDWKQNHRDKLNTFSRRSHYRREVQQRYFLTENEVCRLKKAYEKKIEEFERAHAEYEALSSNSTDVKPIDSNSYTHSNHVSFSDSDIILLDTEATIEIGNQLGVEETSDPHISKEQTPQEERPE